MWVCKYLFMLPQCLIVGSHFDWSCRVDASRVLPKNDEKIRNRWSNGLDLHTWSLWLLERHSSRNFWQWRRNHLYRIWNSIRHPTTWRSYPLAPFNLLSVRLLLSLEKDGKGPIIENLRDYRNGYLLKVEYRIIRLREGRQNTRICFPIDWIRLIDKIMIIWSSIIITVLYY